MSGYTPTPLSGYTPSTATSYTHGGVNGMGTFTGAPLTNAPLQMPVALSTSSNHGHGNSPAHSNSLPSPLPGSSSMPIQMSEGAPTPFYARRRTDSERSARSGRSGRSGGADASPGSTPPSARVNGMAWPAIGGAGAVSPQNAREGGSAREVLERERNASGGSPVSISISAPMLTGPVDGGGMQGQGVFLFLSFFRFVLSARLSMSFPSSLASKTIR